jgi:hypothetical protein
VQVLLGGRVVQTVPWLTATRRRFCCSGTIRATSFRFRFRYLLTVRPREWEKLLMAGVGKYGRPVLSGLHCHQVFGRT